MGRLFDRFTSNNAQDSAFHSSGLTDPKTRQIGGGISGSFLKRQSLRRKIIQNYQNSQLASTTYRSATGVGSKTYQQSIENTTEKEDSALRGGFLANPRPGAAPNDTGRHTFTEPTSRSRDPFDR